MILPVFLLAVAGGVAALYWSLRRARGDRSLVRRALFVGLTLGLARAGLASAGWYTMEHTGGPLQIPAYALAMLALPEAAVLRTPRLTPATPAFYVQLTMLLVTTTVALVAAVALVVKMRR